MKQQQLLEEERIANRERALQEKLRRKAARNHDTKPAE